METRCVARSEKLSEHIDLLSESVNRIAERVNFCPKTCADDRGQRKTNQSKRHFRITAEKTPLKGTIDSFGDILNCSASFDPRFGETNGQAAARSGDPATAVRGD